MPYSAMLRGKVMPNLYRGTEHHQKLINFFDW